MDPRDFAAKHLAELEQSGRVESAGSFSLNEVQASRLMSSVLAGDPYQCSVFVARAALAAGASRIRCVTVPGQLRIYDDAPTVELDEAQQLRDGEFVSPQLRQLVVAFRLALALKPTELYYVTERWILRWNGSNFTLERPRLKRDLLKRNYFFCRLSGLSRCKALASALRQSLKFTEPPIRFGLGSGDSESKAAGIRLDSPAVEYWEDRQRPMSFVEDHIRLPAMVRRESPGPYSVALWLQPKPSKSSRLTLLDQGLVLCSRTIQSGYPGWEAVVWSDQWSYDLSGQIREDDFYSQLMSQLKSAAWAMLETVAERQRLCPSDSNRPCDQLKPLPSLPLFDEFQHLELSPDSLTLMVLSSDQWRLLRRRDSALQLVAAYPRQLGVSGYWQRCSFCADNQTFALVLETRQLGVFRCVDGSCQRILELEEDIFSLSFGPTGSDLYVQTEFCSLWRIGPSDTAPMAIFRKPSVNVSQVNRFLGPMVWSACGGWLSLQYQYSLLIYDCISGALHWKPDHSLSAFDPGCQFVITLDLKRRSLGRHWLSNLEISETLVAAGSDNMQYARGAFLWEESLFWKQSDEGGYCRLHLSTARIEVCTFDAGDGPLKPGFMLRISQGLLLIDRERARLYWGRSTREMREISGQFCRQLWGNEFSQSFVVASHKAISIMGREGRKLAELESFLRLPLTAGDVPDRVSLGSKASLRPSVLDSPQRQSSIFLYRDGILSCSEDQKWLWNLSSSDWITPFQKLDCEAGEWKYRGDQLTCQQPDQPIRVKAMSGADYKVLELLDWDEDRVLVKQLDSSWWICSRESGQRQVALEPDFVPGACCDSLNFVEEQYWSWPNTAVPLLSRAFDPSFKPETYNGDIRYAHRARCFLTNLAWHNSEVEVLNLGGQKLRTIQGEARGACARSLDPTGRWLVLINSREVVVHDLASGNLVSRCSPLGLVVSSFSRWRFRGFALGFAQINHTGLACYVWSSEGDRLCVWDRSSHNAVVLKLDLETGAIAMAGQLKFASRASLSCWFDNSSFRQELMKLVGGNGNITHDIQLFRQALVLLVPGAYFEIYELSGELRLRVYLLSDGYAALSPDGRYDGSGQCYQGCLANCQSLAAPMSPQANLLQAVWSELT